MGQDKSKCKAVIELKGDEEIVYNLEGVEEMIRDGPAKGDTKVFVICISGVYRSGKSFLLNLLKTYLDHYCENSADVGWVNCRDTQIKGGSWAQGQKIVTRGIQMYMYPRLINEKAVILMDCQGTRDVMKSTPTLDNLIMFLGLHLSDVHILNVNRTLRADDLDRLDMCVFHGRDGSSERLFERQIFLIRNWGSDEEPQQLEKLIETSSSESVKSTAEGIKNTFKAVEVDTLPYPGASLDGSSEPDNICLGDVDHEFLKKASELFHRLILVFPSEARMSGADFISSFELLSKRDVGKIRSPQELYEESMVKNIYTKSIAHFKSEVEEPGKQKNMTTEQLAETVKAIYEETERMFNENKRVRNCKNRQMTIDYLGYLKKEYEKTLELMKSTFEVEMLNNEVQKKKEDEEAATKELNATQDKIKKYRLDEEMKQSVVVDNDTHENAEVEGHLPTTKETTQDVAVDTNTDVLEPSFLTRRLDAADMREANHKSQIDSVQTELKKQKEASAQAAERCCQLEKTQEVLNQKIRDLEVAIQSKRDTQVEELKDANQKIANLERDKVHQEQELRSLSEKQKKMEMMMDELKHIVDQTVNIGPEMDQEHDDDLAR